MMKTQMTKHKKKSKKANSSYLKKKIVSILLGNPKKRYSPKSIKKKLKISNSADQVRAAMDELVKANKILKLKPEVYKANKNFIKKVIENSLNTYKGIVDMTKRGAGFILVDGLDDDVFVPAKFLMGAMNKDEVLISVSENSKGKKPSGKVIEIVKRNITQVVGKFRKLNKFGIVEYKGKHGIIDVNVNPDDFNGAVNGDSVLVEITSWGKNQNKSLWGKIDEVLTETDAHNFAMQQIIIENGFELSFPDEVMAATKKLTQNISDQEIALRKDIREITTLTIDPLTAQDFDDALSIRKLENGNIEVGVHIADVSHYVKPGSVIDKEAFKRSTSVYLVDRCVPMLPEILSNKLCSLRPDEDSLCFSAIFEFNEKYKIENKWFGKTVIHSDRRFTYEEAQEIIENGEGEYAEELASLNKIAKKLRKQKYKNGAISFETEEVQFKLDENNRPVDIFVKERKDAHLLVEDFMLLANKSAAKYIADKGKEKQTVPFVYRIHDLPNMERLTDFSLFAKELGFKMNLDTPKNIAKSFNAMAKAAKEDEVIALLQPLAIRTMSKAIYTTENIGHYGLAFEHYTHFTSPIRRYSDLLVHRILEKNIDSTLRVKKDELEAQCAHISKMERSAMDAERESVKYKQVEYLLDKIGQEFEGFISGMIDSGFFVQLKESKAEGLIRFDQLDEPYDLHESRLYATAIRSKSKITMGMKVLVKVEDADMELRQVDLELIDFIK